MLLEFLFFKNGIGGALSTDYFGQLKELSDASFFIETGTYFGNTVDEMRGIFDQVISIELDLDLHSKAVERFRECSNVEILQGDSASMLEQALRKASGKNSILWLDAHYSGEGTSFAGENTPIVREIEILDRVGGMADIVLVDDIRMFGKVAPGFLTHEAIHGYPDLVVLVERLQACKQKYVSFLIGDMLLALPGSLQEKYEASEVVRAVTRLRIGEKDSQRVAQLEGVVASASGIERETIMKLPDIFQQQLLYGLGGDFCYWRGLIHEMSGSKGLANADFEFARRCGVKGASREIL